MDLPALIEALSDQAAYPHPVDRVEVHQTHISAVFLAGEFAYKIKKPVNLGFVDYSTAGRRRHFCEEELRLNRRLAPDVYLGVEPIVATGAGVRVGGPGEPVEWAVRMRRLPADRRLVEAVRSGKLAASTLVRLAHRLAAFHEAAEAGPRVSASARLESVARNVRENLDGAVGHVGQSLSRPVLDRLKAAFETALDRLGPLIESRASRHIPRDGHGDLRLDHVYHFPDRPAPGDLVVVDGIEFEARYRHADPVADVAFLAMDLIREGRRDLADRFADAYFGASGDREGRDLLPFYMAYRAAVRGKVEGIEARELEVPEEVRYGCLSRAVGAWLLALGMLEPSESRPGLVVVGGTPGAGKSTLSRRVAVAVGFEVVRSDEVRKELAGLSASDPAGVPFGAGIYSEDWNRRTYAECLRRVEHGLFEGRRLLVDASFRAAADRQAVAQLVRRMAVPAVLLVCQAAESTIRDRLASRRGDASDADWSIHRAVASAWEPIQSTAALPVTEVATDDPAGDPLDEALGALRRAGLCS